MEPATQAVPGYFVWQVPGQPVVVHLSVDVVDRMGADIMRGFGAVPKRGAEVGGILIGTIERGDVSTVRINDFEPIPCTYARGPSYLLTDAERVYFDEVCQRRSTEIVGYYRSHTRDGLALQPEDIQLLDRHFSQPAQVALLVKPFATKPGVAGFFVRNKGVFPAATPLEFPFRRWEMTGEEPPRRPSAARTKPEGKRPGSRLLPNRAKRAPPLHRQRRRRTTVFFPLNPKSLLRSHPRSREGRSRGPACGWWRASSSCCWESCWAMKPRGSPPRSVVLPISPCRSR